VGSQHQSRQGNLQVSHLHLLLVNLLISRHRSRVAAPLANQRVDRQVSQQVSQLDSLQVSRVQDHQVNHLLVQRLYGKKKFASFSKSRSDF